MVPIKASFPQAIIILIIQMTDLSCYLMEDENNIIEEKVPDGEVVVHHLIHHHHH